MYCLGCNIEINDDISFIKIALPGMNYKVLCLQCWPWIETLIYRLGNYYIIIKTMVIFTLLI